MVVTAAAAAAAAAPGAARAAPPLAAAPAAGVTHNGGIQPAAKCVSPPPPPQLSVASPRLPSACGSLRPQRQAQPPRTQRAVHLSPPRSCCGCLAPSASATQPRRHSAAGVTRGGKPARAQALAFDMVSISDATLSLNDRMRSRNAPHWSCRAVSATAPWDEDAAAAAAGQSRLQVLRLLAQLRVHDAHVVELVEEDSAGCVHRCGVDIQSGEGAAYREDLRQAAKIDGARAAQRARLPF